jgi:hypothetical protein
LLPREVEAKLQIEQRLPGNLDAQSYGTLRRLVALIDSLAPATDPEEVFSTVEAALIRAYEAPEPEQLAITHSPTLAMMPIATAEPVTVALPPPPYG